MIPVSYTHLDVYKRQIYTITVLNQYTGEETVKKIYVGTDSVLKAHMMTGYSIGDIQTLIQNGATIDKEGKITVQEQIEMPEVVESVSNSAIVLNEAEDLSLIHIWWL